ncbi:hypothetical protein [Streptomyces nitrosporeus]|uniref:hypothetical protein n=1 Tax=Streptomyces nitrosporeus TaxID=28894 RepID=UPI00167CCDA2|nr:hypothetical protein [Streptomyces nitrosporeus]GGZ30349.1 hypothetical protein GCM10010327_70660 [Streptomyces nitrosporeus]
MSIENVEDKTETACRICGHDDGVPVFDAYGVPQYVICPCCYNESGIGDDNVSQVRELRGYWVANGAQWHEPKLRPADWDLLKQVANIPPDWR